MNKINFYQEMKTFIEKAIGTSSSIDQERDERSVENYVRTGGDIIMNTTEPDPKGDIAVQKTLPDGKVGPLIGQETRPVDGATSVSDAPNNDGAISSATFESSATSAIAPTSAEMAEATEESIEKAAKCPSCGQAMPVEKAASCSDCGKSMDLCDCMGKSIDEEANETTPDDEKAEMKKSIWGGAFAPTKL